MRRSLRRAASGPALAAALLLAGCAQFSDDAGQRRVAEQAAPHLQALQAAAAASAPALAQPALAPANAEAAAALRRQRNAELLAAPLSAEAAVQLALLNHRGLQAQLAGLGVNEAELVQAGQIRLPRLGIGRLAGGGVVEWDQSLVFDVLGLVTRSANLRRQQGRFEAAQWQAAQAAVAVATEARRAWLKAVTAQALLRYREQVQDAADTARTLAERMKAAGHYNALQQAREQAFAAESQAALVRAKAQAAIEAERLQRALGLAGAPAFTLPEQLPALPAPLATAAVPEGRLDVQQARLALRVAEAEAGVVQATGPLDDWGVGLQQQRATGEDTRRGFTLDIGLATDFGAARRRAAAARLQQAQAQAEAVALRGASEQREAALAYSAAAEAARILREQVVPLRQRISEEYTLRYNGMLASVFELLIDAREQIAAVVAALEAERDAHLAWTDTLAARSGAAAPATALNTAPAAEARSAGH